MSLAWFLGRKIIQIDFTYEDIGIRFEDGTGVTIYNSCSIMEGFHPSRYIGAKVIVEHWSRDQFYADLDNGNRITVDLREEAWRGPEAMIFSYENNGMMVVNEAPEQTVVFREESDI